MKTEAGNYNRLDDDTIGRQRGDHSKDFTNVVQPTEAGKEIRHILEELVAVIGKQVAAHPNSKDGFYEGLSVQNVRTINRTERELLGLVSQAEQAAYERGTKHLVTMNKFGELMYDKKQLQEARQSVLDEIVEKLKELEMSTPLFDKGQLVLSKAISIINDVRDKK